MKAEKLDSKNFRPVPYVQLPFIDFAGNLEKRWGHMNGVLEDILNGYTNPKILDIASGGGHDTIFLSQKGYDVTANEVDEKFAVNLRDKIKASEVQPKVLSIDWRDFLNSNELEDEKYDVLFALGNSYPNYLFKESEREVALKGFWRVLKPRGTLFFDTRNYDYILSHAQEILEDPEHNFRYSHKTTYTNEDIRGYPIEITPQRVRLQYKYYPKKRSAYLDLCPATIESVTSLIKKLWVTLDQPFTMTIKLLSLKSLISFSMF
ncbi:MAG TPA: class I SAM-dependent methyltransferase [Candidatus Saccharimonadales bacterium]|nr:class I SAM-dependent methyltransferase [Candidatus Saccharimonadales bacterium]